jgi:hypothetical protein
LRDLPSTQTSAPSAENIITNTKTTNRNVDLVETTIAKPPMNDKAPAERKINGLHRMRRDGECHRVSGRKENASSRKRTMMMAEMKAANPSVVERKAI